MHRKKGTLTKLSFITSFIQQTPKGHLAKKTLFFFDFYLLLLLKAIELPNTYNTNMADPCTFAAFCKHIILNNLLLFVKLVLLCNLLMQQHFPTLCQVSVQVPGPGFCHFSALSNHGPFVDARITTWTSSWAVIQSNVAFWFWSVMTERVCDGAVFICMPSYMRGLFLGDSAAPSYSKHRKNEALIYLFMPYSSYMGLL